MRIVIISLAVFVLAIEVFAHNATVPQTQAMLRGQITDELGGLIAGATITLVDSKGVEKTTTSNREGVYVINGLAPGKYTLRISAIGFAFFDGTNFISDGDENVAEAVEFGPGFGFRGLDH